MNARCTRSALAALALATSGLLASACAGKKGGRLDVIAWLAL